MIGPRFILLQAMLCAGLAALWFTGPLHTAVAGESRWFCASVWTVALIGLGLVAARRYGDARWIGDRLVVLAIIGMQCGIIVGLGVAAQQIGSGGDMSKAVGQFFAAITVALYVSVSALSGHLWIDLNLKLLGYRDA